MKHSAGLLKKAALVISAVLVIYAISDVLYRVYWHSHLEHNFHQNARYTFSSTEAPLYVLDRQTGYSYRQNLKLNFRLYDEWNNFVRENRLITNNFGHFELENDSIKKPKSEFRIAILGDSFSATPTSDVTWPTELQQDLNQDVALKKIIGKSTFKVINFGLDGTGIVQWPSVYQDKVKAFAPDLVIVNFIWNDIYRKFIYRKTISINNDDQIMVTCSSLPADIENDDCRNAYSFVLDTRRSGDKEEILRFKKKIYDKMVARLPWFSFYPELLAAVLGDRLDLHSGLQLQDGSLPYFKSSDAALSASLSALGTIASEQHALIVLYHPTFEECIAKQPPPMVKDLMEREKNVQIENMLDFLPLTSSQDEIRKWYNLPYDMHPSNSGAEVYARAVESRVLEYLSHSDKTVLKSTNSDSRRLTGAASPE